MRRLFTVRAGAGAIAALGLAAILASAAHAQPTYCMREGWYFADAHTNGNRQDPQWSYYAALFFDYNDCNGDNACDDITIPCVAPPV